jgi:Interferon-induced transmembrane protein
MQPGDEPPRIGNNMGWAIGAIFLFPPLAVPALMNAAKVRPLLEQGNYAEAQAAAADSKKWSKLATIIGVFMWLAVICCVGTLFAGLYSMSRNTR